MPKEIEILITVLRHLKGLTAAIEKYLNEVKQRTEHD